MSEVALAEDTNKGEIASKSSSFTSSMEAPDLVEKIICLFSLVALGAVFACQTFFPDSIERVIKATPNLWLSNGLIFLLCIPPAITLLKPPSSKARMLMLVGQVLVLSFAAPLGAPKLFQILYNIYVAHAGLLMRWRGLAAFLVFAVACHTGSKELRYYLTEPWIYAQPLRDHVVHVLVYGRLVNFALGLGLSALCTAALAQERRLRTERAALNKTVEDMAARVERTRMAREIHDSAGHIMTSMCMQLDVATALSQKKPEKTADSLKLVLSLVKQLGDEFRSLSRDAAELQGEFKTYLADLEKQYEADGWFRLVVDCRVESVPDSLTHDLFSMIKESLHNVKKYAQASEVVLQVENRDGFIVASVKDNGNGFDLQTVKATSFGLKGMRERAAKHGGTVDVESAPGQGTLVKIRFPAS